MTMSPKKPPTLSKNSLFRGIPAAREALLRYQISTAEDSGGISILKMPSFTW